MICRITQRVSGRTHTASIDRSTPKCSIVTAARITLWFGIRYLFFGPEQYDWLCPPLNLLRKSPSQLSKSAKLTFPRKLNSDGTYDLICPNCVMTIGSEVAKESELLALERLHECPGFKLGQLLDGTPPVKIAPKAN